jgi:N-acetylglucosamine malate deacetylase 1
LGYTTGIADLTRGELGTRGNAETRETEAARAAKILQVAMRENLGMADGFFLNDREHQLKIIHVLRKYRPDVVLANAVDDRHTDHGKAAKLVADACFLSGLRRIETRENGDLQEAWRPRAVYHYIQDRHLKPDLVVDISAYWEAKRSAILAYETQFYNPGLTEPQTPISSEDFLHFLEGRAREMGRIIGARYGEGFTVSRSPGVRNFLELD